MKKPKIVVLPSNTRSRIVLDSFCFEGWGLPSLERKILFVASVLLWWIMVDTTTESMAANSFGAASNVVAEVGSEKITSDEVDEGIAADVFRLEGQIYNLRKQRLDAIIDERLLASEAARQKITVRVLLDREVTAKVTLVTEQEVNGYYEANKAQFPGDSRQVRQQIRDSLQNQRWAEEREKYLRALRSNAQVVINLHPPTPLRVDVSAEPAPTAQARPPEAQPKLISIADAPSKGEATAKVTLIEFTDYQCPFCGRHARDAFPQIDREYIETGKVKYILRDAPIESIHAQAFKAAEAARCAGEQDKYWEMHDRLFANQNSLGRDDLTLHAKAVGLDVKVFEDCIDSGKEAARIRKDLADSQAAGITGTPTFFLGMTDTRGAPVRVVRTVVGAVGYPAIKQAIDSVLSDAR
jgi:protein-disulfide isomerase